MTNTYDANELLDGGAPSFSFKNAPVGTTAKGVITKLDTAQVRDYDTEKPKFWDDDPNKPVMQAVITLRQDDGEEKRLFCKPAMAAAIREARDEAGASKIEVGGRLAVQFTGEEPHQNPKFNAIKKFKAQYQAPVNNVAADELL